MAIYQGMFGNVARFVRADSLGEAVHTMRAAFGFAPKGYISRIGDNAHSVGFAGVYDQAANHIDNANHRALKQQRKAARTRHAAGKGAAIPAGVEVLDFSNATPARQISHGRNLGNGGMLASSTVQHA